MLEAIAPVRQAVLSVCITEFEVEGSSEINGELTYCTSRENSREHLDLHPSVSIGTPLVWFPVSWSRSCDSRIHSPPWIR